ncbi:MAG: crossover junction endodeoxyribonuclease RuvC [Candidatus Saganbacteria bacterium]|nr:crossover junction endodeoxyribonuclease RuvC [Candidatus Saganbacteria bacterium]
MLTLGIDPGTATTGFGLISENRDRLSFVDHGVITTSSKETSQGRLRKIYCELKKLVQDYKPRVIAVEKIFFGKNTKTAMAVGQARGIILLAAAELKVPVSEYSPLEVKVAVTGYGRADKKQVQQMVKHLLGLSFVPSPDDASDALAIAICHLHSYKMASL